MVQSGKSLPLIGRVLGHKNESSTKVYAQWAPEVLDPLRAALNEHGQRVSSMMGKKLGLVQPMASNQEQPSDAHTSTLGRSLASTSGTATTLLLGVGAP